MAGVAMAIGVSTISRQVISFMSPLEFLSRVNEGFYGADAVLQVIIFALAFSFINTLFGFILVAIDKQSRLLYINLTGLIIAVILNFFLIPWLGIRGAGITDIIVELTVAVAAYYFAHKYLQFKIKFNKTIKIIIAGIIMGIVITLLDHPTSSLLNSSVGNKNVIILIPLGAIIYIGLLFVFKVITKDMLKVLKKSNAANEPLETTNI